MPSVVHTDILLLYSTVVPSVVRLWSYLYIGIYSCRLCPLVTSCGRPIVCSRSYCVPVALACLLSVSWYLLSALVACLVATVIRDVPTVATVAPRGYPQEARYPTLRRGGDFSKRGEGLTETKPVLIFMREVKKNVVFQRKMGEIQLETVVFKRKTSEIGENLRKRKESKEKKRE